MTKYILEHKNTYDWILLLIPTWLGIKLEVSHMKDLSANPLAMAALE